MASTERKSLQEKDKKNLATEQQPSNITEEPNTTTDINNREKVSLPMEADVQVPGHSVEATTSTCEVVPSDTTEIRKSQKSDECAEISSGDEDHEKTLGNLSETTSKWRSCGMQTEETTAMQEFEESLRIDQNQCFFYTGLKFNHIEILLNLLSPECHHLQYWNTFAKDDCDAEDPEEPLELTIMQQLILVLMRLRLGLLIEDMAFRFNISVGSVTNVIITWVQFLYIEFDEIFRATTVDPIKDVKRQSMFPTRHKIARTLPKSFEELRNIRVLVDCVEFCCQSSSNIEEDNSYSSRKAHSTVKVLIGCIPKGGICFVSDAYEGSSTEREIFIRSNFTDFLEEGDLVLANRGFQVADLVEQKGAELSILQEGVDPNLIAKRRISVEHVVDKLRQFQILQETSPLTISETMSKVVFICACLVNFQEPIVE